uniref:DUF3278 domain-containing protein n=1 Tax=Rhabditophanes sp. KR3021 TaxID=114890 RepID=A0AC35TID8_9BILA
MDKKLNEFIQQQQLQNPDKLSKFLKRLHLFGIASQVLFLIFAVGEIGLNALILPIIGLALNFCVSGKRFIDKVDAPGEFKRGLDLRDFQTSAKLMGNFFSALFLTFVCYAYCWPEDLGILNGFLFGTACRITMLSVTIFTIVDIYRAVFKPKVL